MTYNPDIHKRRSIRLKDYDYSSAGAYFVTICTKDKECMFGDVRNGEMMLNEYGQIVRDMCHNISDHFPHGDIDEFIVMPNHFHGIIAIVGAQFIAPLNDCNRIQNRKQGAINHAPTVGEIVRAFKARCTHAINTIRNTPVRPVWQRKYYERIVRDKNELQAIRQYIVENPMKWDMDNENPSNSIVGATRRVSVRSVNVNRDTI